MIWLRHRATAGRIANTWSFDKLTNSAKVTLERGVEHILPICSHKNMREGHYPVSRRLDGWELAPVYIHNGSGMTDKRLDFMSLDGAPYALNEELSEI
jgi:hypothetical protein